MLEIPVLGRKVGVRFESDKELQKLSNEPDCVGLYDGNTQTIYLSVSLSYEGARYVLLHELAHAFLNITGLTQLLDDKQEEAVCTAFESYLDVFRSTEVISFLKKAEEE
jgi:Zn-dependent peptidase ImmA (M78 family)